MALKLVPPLVNPPLAIEVALGPARPEGAVEQIVRRIGEAIGAGILEPGTQLPPEAELATRLEVAPMTLRQALAVLRSAGFIETRRGRGGGSFVREVTLPTPSATCVVTLPGSCVVRWVTASLPRGGPIRYN